MELPKDIKDEIWEYCRVNDITDLNNFITKMVKNGFTSEKFGSTPWKKPVEIKEVEKIVEKEVIKEVEKIVEVIKEVEVEKEVFVTDDEANKALKKGLEETTQTLREMTLDFGAERKVSSETIKGLNDEIDVLNREKSDLHRKIKQLENELETVKNKSKRDIYGDTYE